jgi:pilus assembly protein CpaB
VKRVFVLGMLVLAVISGTAASVMTYRVLKNRTLDAGALVFEKAPTLPLVTAAVRLPYGTVLQAAHLRVVEWASPDRPEGTFTDPTAVIGRATIVGTVPGEPILESRLAPKDAGGGLASVIPVGKRAVSVRVNEVIGVAGFALPRTRVDVLVSVNPGGDKGRSASRMILQNVEVLAAGQKIEQDEEGKPETVNVITLLVTPPEAEKLILASNEGDIQLALRNSLDLDPVATTGSVLSGLIQQPKPETAPRRVVVVEKRAATVEVIRGNHRSTETF